MEAKVLYAGSRERLFPVQWKLEWAAGSVRRVAGKYEVSVEPSELAVFFKKGECQASNRDAATLSVFCSLEDNDTGIQVNLAPSQVQDFAPSHSCGEGQNDKWIEVWRAAVLARLKELRALIIGKKPNAAGRYFLASNAAGRIEFHPFPLADTGLEENAQCRKISVPALRLSRSSMAVHTA